MQEKKDGEWIFSVLFLFGQSALLLALYVENFLAVVITASLAYTVAENILTALGALGHAGETKLPIVGTSLVSASL